MHIDISYLKKYFDYEPILGEDPQWVIDEIKSIASEYLDQLELDGIQSAYEYARAAHQWQIRQSWEYYISHIVQATRYLMMIKPDVETIKWCLLHDVIEDCNISFQDIETLFWHTVAKLCEWVTKVSKLKYRWEERQVETIKKTFFAMSEDLRVIFIKFADRVHNIQTLWYHPTPEKRERIAHETLEIYVPIAERLGLYGFQYLLENGCFKILHPQECDQIMVYLDRSIFQKAEIKWVDVLTQLLQSEWLMDFHVKGRLKSPYRIYRKMSEKYNTNDLNSIYDLLAFRVLVDSVANCYLVMGIIHNKLTPLVHKIKDYIVVPKPNGYQSIHSTILGMFNFPVEIQIRTFQMDRSAEFGVAAHFAYKEADYGGRSVKVDDRQSQRVLQLQEIVKSYQEDNESFKSEMKIELLDDNIFLYTPKGEVVEMKKWSTVLDFAFKIHSQVWLRFKNALVNGSIVPIDYKPNTGDIVTINTWKNHIWVSASWTWSVKTSLARNQINKYLKSFQRPELLDKSLKNLNQKLSEMGYPPYESENCKIHKAYKEDQERFEWLLLEMMEKGWYRSFINTFYKKYVKKEKNIPVLHTISEPTEPKIYIDWQSNYDYIWCSECNKSKSDMIIWKVDKKVIKLHRIWCRALSHLNFEKLVPAYFEWKKTKYRFEFHLKLNNTYGILNKILAILTKYSVNIDTISFVESGDDFTIGNITIEVENPSKIWFVLKSIKNLDSIEVLSKKFLKPMQIN